MSEPRIFKTYTLQEVGNKVAELIPEGWQIEIALEKDSGDVGLFNPHGEKVTYAVGDGGLHSDVDDALDHAITHNDEFLETE